ncbi:MAG: HNH endonuclease family protein [Ancrocorticia sp.]|uniref:HNH endonuclease family protein n=1 Tax=Ancrocorticia sp. TaxID=2593684 RepID=UPI003F9054C9
MAKNAGRSKKLGTVWAVVALIVTMGIAQAAGQFEETADGPGAGKASPSSSQNVSQTKNPTGSAADALADLPIKGRAPKTGYSRDQYGPSWADVDRNGCDTRNDILDRDLVEKTYKAGTHDCIVLTGVLNDPYTATQIDFQRGQDTSTAVQIDHVVALSDSWQKGAQQLSEDQRKEFANDPYNLLAVDGPANGQKSDGDAATWLPANKGYRCEYVARQIGVKQKYELWVTQGEHDAMANVLSTCPGEPLPEY